MTLGRNLHILVTTTEQQAEADCFPPGHGVCGSGSYRGSQARCMRRGHPSSHVTGFTIRKQRDCAVLEGRTSRIPMRKYVNAVGIDWVLFFSGSMIKNWHGPITRQAINQTQRERGGSYRRAACQRRYPSKRGEGCRPRRISGRGEDDPRSYVSRRRARA